jgi:uncharacterized membrane protein YgaE (UPF0421/DUF939 family)
LEEKFHIAQASLGGLFKTILIIIGAFVALRFIGQMMIAKRNLDEQRDMEEKEKKFQRERKEKLRDFGKVTVSKSNPATKGDIQDIDFEEIQ